MKFQEFNRIKYISEDFNYTKAAKYLLQLRKLQNPGILLTVGNYLNKKIIQGRVLNLRVRIELSSLNIVKNKATKIWKDSVR
ncbi:MAG: hypothetical protein IIA49_13155 [Bacteroidetes bacterium]|nr:hypothetical protein [Bacteroidota bacterium]